MTSTKPTTTDWRIVAISGKTADGREISAQEIADMAAQYDPATYAARINLEHLRFIFPYPEVSGFGDVVALKAEKQANGKTALLAKLAVNGNLQALWNADQKVYSSIEIISPFADTGKAYLVGLAVTDNPASLGTSRHFSVTGAAAVAATKSIHFSEYAEMTESAQNTQTAGLFAALLAKFAKQEAQAPAETQTADTKADNTPADTETTSITKLTADLAAARQDLEASAEFATQMLEKHETLAAEFAAFKQQVEATPLSGQRPPHTGGGDQVKSDF